MDVGRGGVIRTRGIQIPKLALYQAELRPGGWNLAETLGKANLAAPTGIARNGPESPLRSRTSPEVVRG